MQVLSFGMKGVEIDFLSTFNTTWDFSRTVKPSKAPPENEVVFDELGKNVFHMEIPGDNQEQLDEFVSVPRLKASILIDTADFTVANRDPSMTARSYQIQKAEESGTYVCFFAEALYDWSSDALNEAMEDHGESLPEGRISLERLLELMDEHGLDRADISKSFWNFRVYTREGTLEQMFQVYLDSAAHWAKETTIEEADRVLKDKIRYGTHGDEEPGIPFFLYKKCRYTTTMVGRIILEDLIQGYMDSKEFEIGTDEESKAKWRWTNGEVLWKSRKNKARVFLPDSLDPGSKKNRKMPKGMTKVAQMRAALNLMQDTYKVFALPESLVLELGARTTTDYEENIFEKAISRMGSGQ